MTIAVVIGCAIVSFIILLGINYLEKSFEYAKIERALITCIHKKGVYEMVLAKNWNKLSEEEKYHIINLLERIDENIIQIKKELEEI